MYEVKVDRSMEWNVIVGIGCSGAKRRKEGEEKLK